MHADDVQAAILRSTCKAMMTLKHADALDPRVMTLIDMPRLGGNISLQARRVPDFNGFIIGGSHEKYVIRGYRKPSDGIGMRV